MLLTVNNIELRAGLTEGFDDPEGETYRRAMKAFYTRVDDFDAAVKQSCLYGEKKGELTRRLPIAGSAFRGNIP
jgi:hypothetical protein